LYHFQQSWEKAYKAHFVAVLVSQGASPSPNPDFYGGLLKPLGHSPYSRGQHLDTCRRIARVLDGTSSPPSRLVGQIEANIRRIDADAVATLGNWFQFLDGLDQSRLRYPSVSDSTAGWLPPASVADLDWFSNAPGSTDPFDDLSSVLDQYLNVIGIELQMNSR
jgi:hypothetical protein